MPAFPGPAGGLIPRDAGARLQRAPRAARGEGRVGEGLSGPAAGRPSVPGPPVAAAVGGGLAWRRRACARSPGRRAGPGVLGLPGRSAGVRSPGPGPGPAALRAGCEAAASLPPGLRGPRGRGAGCARVSVCVCLSVRPSVRPSSSSSPAPASRPFLLKIRVGCQVVCYGRVPGASSAPRPVRFGACVFFFPPKLYARAERDFVARRLCPGPGRRGTGGRVRGRSPARLPSPSLCRGVDE